MIISIKSEIDSRCVLYPLMKACYQYGTVAVITSNKFVKRLIDDKEFNTFRNIDIYYDELGASDDVYRANGIDKLDFDFIILDNMGVSEYDRCICLFGSKQSEIFMEDKKLMEESEDVSKIVFVEFGNSKSSSRDTRTEEKKSKPSRNRGNNGAQQTQDENVVPEGYDPAEKFRSMVKTEKRKEVIIFKAPFPSLADFEMVEGLGKFYNMPDKLIPVFYEIFGKKLNIVDNEFRKGLKKVDESGYNIGK